MPRAIRSGIASRTFRTLAADYLVSTAFLTLAPSSQRAYRRVVARLVRQFGPRPVADLNRQEIERWLAGRTPGAATDDLKKFRVLMRMAQENGWRADDPTRGIRRHRPGDGWHAWTEGEIQTFERHWPLGTRERTAFALLLHMSIGGEL